MERVWLKVLKKGKKIKSFSAFLYRIRAGKPFCYMKDLLTPVVFYDSHQVDNSFSITDTVDSVQAGKWYEANEQ